MEEKDNLVEKLKAAVGKLAGKYGLKFAILYGSQAGDRIKKDSDIDVAVLGNKFLDFQKIIKLSGELSDLIDEDDLDLKSLHGADPLFRYEVVNGGILIFGDELEYVRFQTYGFRDYMDSSSLLRLKEAMVKKRLGLIN